jgi:hypothetical protein
MHQGVALGALIMASVAQENTHDKKPIVFNPQDVATLCEKAILNGMDVPFEVVGHKQLLATMLNKQLTQYEKGRIIRDWTQKALPEDIRTKLQAIIHETMEETSKKITEAGLGPQIEWRKLYYKYNFDLSLWDKHLGVPSFVVAKIHEYVMYLNLEKNFENTDFSLYSY